MSFSWQQVTRFLSKWGHLLLIAGGKPCHFELSLEPKITLNFNVYFFKSRFSVELMEPFLQDPDGNKALTPAYFWTRVE